MNQWITRVFIEQPRVQPGLLIIFIIIIQHSSSWLNVIQDCQNRFYWMFDIFLVSLQFCSTTKWHVVYFRSLWEREPLRPELFQPARLHVRVRLQRGILPLLKWIQLYRYILCVASSLTEHLRLHYQCKERWDLATVPWWFLWMCYSVFVSSLQAFKSKKLLQNKTSRPRTLKVKKNQTQLLAWNKDYF